MDAITLLKDDHRKVKGLFRKFEQAGDRAFATKKKLVDRITEELSVHAAIEEQVFYPSVRHAIEATEDDVLESLEEHHIVKWTLSELERWTRRTSATTPRSPSSSRSVEHHIGEEEYRHVPEGAQGAVAHPAERARRPDGARQAGRAEATASPRPPDEPPGNVVGGPVLAILDAGKEAVKKVTTRGRRTAS